jgi:hypothetical protein
MKISQTHNVTKSGTIKRNPRRKALYEVVYDSGKPYNVFYVSETSMKKGLKDFYLAHKDDDSYYDIQVYNMKGEDITESQFVQEMISDIIGE